MECIDLIFNSFPLGRIISGFKLHVFYSYAFKRHEPFIGFEFAVNSNPVSNYGLDLGYRYYPNRDLSGFDLFFTYLMQANSRKLYSNSTTNGFSLHNVAGYGFNVYLTSGLYIKHFLAAGIENSWFGEDGSFSDFSLIISLGIGLRINKPSLKE